MLPVKLKGHMPESVVSKTLYLGMLPQSHMGKEIKSDDAGVIGQLYYDYMEQLVQEAELEFLGIPLPQKKAVQNLGPHQIRKVIPFRKKET